MHLLVLLPAFVATNSVHGAATTDPIWGCGLLGPLPGIQAGGVVSPDAQRLIDGIKVSSSFNMTTYWNWNYAPEKANGQMQYLSKDFIFMPEQWGIGAVEDKYVRTAGQFNFLDSEGAVCPAKMATIFLGANEPDMIGSCMGTMFGQCTAPCTDAEVAAKNCPVCHLTGAPAKPNAAGHCDCWSDSHSTGSGFWPVAGCNGQQPLPKLFQDQACTSVVMDHWKQTAQTVARKGYQYLSTPLIAVNMDWLKDFVTAACKDCNSPSCGCPSHVGWHFYASDCRPTELGGYADFQNKLDKTKALMEEFPHLKGAIINEVGMLNCAQSTPDGPCIPNGPAQKYPASSQPNGRCPSTDELPNGLGSFIKELIRMVKGAKTSDGRPVVAGFSWFNEKKAGGTYDLRLFNDDGSLNDVGEALIEACQDWASDTNPNPPSPSPTCKVGDPVQCSNSPYNICAGSQCCMDGSTCPSASPDFKGCPKPKVGDCTTSESELVV